MSRTIRSIILSTLNAYNYDLSEWVSPGELFRYAQENRDYTGTQEELLVRARDLARRGVIESKQRGRMQNKWYRPKQTSPR